MAQPILRHIAHRAVQVAMPAAGILIVLLVFSRQAHAATTGSHQGGATSAGSPVSQVVSSVSQAGSPGSQQGGATSADSQAGSPPGASSGSHHGDATS